MAPVRAVDPGHLPPAPRARGDGPSSGPRPQARGRCSPRTRGWPRRGPDFRHVTKLLPAHAGMAPVPGRGSPPMRSAPRARGDGPAPQTANRGPGTCSPRTRGWPRPFPSPGRARPLLPAHAGMAPRIRSAGSPLSTAPRARGDGPHHPGLSGGAERLLPAHAGMAPTATTTHSPSGPAPRARGDGPAIVRATAGPPFCSPRTRGWPQPAWIDYGETDLLPAHAGMAPPGSPPPPTPRPAPRARGDGGSGPSGRKQVEDACSPRPQGTTPTSALVYPDPAIFQRGSGASVEPRPQHLTRH